MTMESVMSVWCRKFSAVPARCARVHLSVPLVINFAGLFAHWLYDSAAVKSLDYLKQAKILFRDVVKEWKDGGKEENKLIKENLRKGRNACVKLQIIFRKQEKSVEASSALKTSVSLCIVCLIWTRTEVSKTNNCSSNPKRWLDGKNV